MLSIAIASAEYLICGQASGYLELLKVSHDRQIQSLGYILLSQTGYLNHVARVGSFTGSDGDGTEYEPPEVEGRK